MCKVVNGVNSEKHVIVFQVVNGVNNESREIHPGQGHLFIAVVVKSRNLQFSATNREIGVLPRQIAKLSVIRDNSRFTHFPAIDREIFRFRCWNFQSK